MAKCTAPVLGHRSESAAAACPACAGRYGRSSGYSSYGSYSSPSYSSLGGSGGRSSSSARPRWSRAGSAVSYTLAQVQSLTPSWQATSSFPSCTTRRMKLSAMSVPLLASRSGLDTAEDSMAVIATKIFELVTLRSTSLPSVAGRCAMKPRSAGQLHVGPPP
jgi:hypothetical protein